LPRLRCNVQFPQVVKGRFRVESPVGAVVADEPFESNTILREYALTRYSAYVLVDGGVRASAAPAKVISTQSVYLVVTPGVSVELGNRLRESPTASAAAGVLRELKNKLRTAVSVSVG
jgi:hypothetical protein